jgi:hypothetical protein
MHYSMYMYLSSGQDRNTCISLFGTGGNGKQGVGGGMARGPCHAMCHARMAAGPSVRRLGQRHGHDGWRRGR